MKGSTWNGWEVSRELGAIHMFLPTPNSMYITLAMTTIPCMFADVPRKQRAFMGGPRP